MADKRVSLLWEEFRKESVLLREKFAGLVIRAESLANDKDGDVLNACLALEKELEEWKSLIDRRLPEFSGCVAAAQKAREQHAEGFADRLRRCVEQRGHSVYGESATLIVDGIVYVEVDAPHAKVSVNGVGQRDLSLNGLVSAIDREASRISQSLTQAQDFGQQLLNAYRAETTARGLTFGSQVATLDLLPHILLRRQTSRFLSDPRAEQFSPYPMTGFRADLFSLLKAGNTTCENAEFHWASGSNTKGAVFMLVPSLGRPAHVGRIWFTPTEKASHD